MKQKSGLVSLVFRHEICNVSSSSYFTSSFFLLPGSHQRQWQVDVVGQAACPLEGNGPSRSHLLTDGAHAGHPRRVPTVQTFPVSGNCPVQLHVCTLRYFAMTAQTKFPFELSDFASG